MAPEVDQIAPQEYPVGLYRPDAVIQPIDGWSAFDEGMVEQYHELGFVSVASAFTDSEIQDSIDALIHLVESDLPPTTQHQFENLAAGDLERMTPEERLDNTRKFMWFSHLDERLNRVMTHPQLLQVVERLLGEKPVMFQDMGLMKPPGMGREKPWHQDHAYFNLPEGTKVVGVWIALDEATPENGCMHFLPGRHKSGAIPHWNRRDWQICDADILSESSQVAAPLPAGGCLVFDGLTPHGTPMNRTQTRRRALQYHYCPASAARISTEERMAMFGSEGRDVSC